ncbi:MAG TPA: glutathione S-transferase family protein [Myxococcota bacterium]|nr:glutathione S-transferase family protein [Myxococcota bacterium]
MPELILHQYATSPFSEKVRLALGRKRLAWRSVEQPTILPKPELIPLTGGYRRIPVLQIGADVFCDSQCILRELERRHPEPPLFGRDEATHMAFAAWSDRVLFQTVVGIVFGRIGDAVPKAFLDDRSKLMGRSFDVAQMKAAVPMLRDALRAQLGWLEAQLGDGRRFLLGGEPGLADFSSYHPLWFLQRFHPPSAGELAHTPAVSAWAERIAAIGHGDVEPMEPREALAVARAARPETAPCDDPGDPNGRKPGERIAVVPDDYGRDPVEGELVASSAQEIAIRRDDPELGEIVVHFPRAGFLVLPR